MLRFVARRLFFILIVSIAIIYFSHLGVGLMGSSVPGDDPPEFLPTAKMAGQETVAFFSHLVQGDLGEVPTPSGNRSMAAILSETYGRSMGLVMVALGAAVLIGLAAGLLAALTRQRRREYAVLLLTIIGISAPSFLLAVLLQQGGILYTQTFGRRLVSMGGYGWDFQHLTMPLIVLAVRPLAYITRSTFLSLNLILDEDYIRTAFSKGLSMTRTMLVHALKNLAVPVLTSIGVSFRFSLSVLPLVEFIYGWPGMGLAILQGLTDRIPLQVATLALAIGLTIQVINFSLEFIYRLIDPRLRENA